MNMNMDEEKITNLEEPEAGHVEAGEAAPETAAETEPVTLRKQLEELQAKAEEYLQGLQRERAEFINYKRRVERERAEQRLQAKREVVTDLLPVLDDFARAMDSVPDEAPASDWVKGVEMIQRKLYSILDGLGIVEIEALGRPFDPNLHEAIGQEASDEYEPDHVMEVLQKGYRYGDKVIRPALVRVAR